MNLADILKTFSTWLCLVLDLVLNMWPKMVKILNNRSNTMYLFWEDQPNSWHFVNTSVDNKVCNKKKSKRTLTFSWCSFPILHLVGSFGSLLQNQNSKSNHAQESLSISFAKKFLECQTMSLIFWTSEMAQIPLGKWSEFSLSDFSTRFGWRYQNKNYQMNFWAESETKGSGSI